ncbi:2-component regulator [Escherichia coli]|uniref:2-component regulator n=1 Tax=Escherichia coli TaxID=562 RepID=A0A2X1KUD1_ECOLX|nr:2-component regulator [Escherichia coli]
MLEKDRDHHRVLVDITNAVLSHLDLDDLIADVAREIHHFFGLASVSMVLGDHRKNDKFSLWCSDLSASHCACLPRCMPGESVLLTQTLQNPTTDLDAPCRRSVSLATRPVITLTCI